MEFHKINKELGDLVSDNVKKLESIFPSVVKDGEVDFEELKEILGDFNEVGKEKYEMNWVGKKEAKKIALTPLYGKTLKYIEGDGKNEYTTENLYIEGDNLEVLKLIQSSYYGKVKMIYIDPPYNTGNDFVYNDNYKESKNSIEILEGNIDQYGNRLIKNQKKSAHYHSKWLSMIYCRLLICKNLLKEDGIIFISLDDNEISNLRKICDEVFGEENFVAKLPTIMNLKGNNDQFGFSGTHEYTLVYIKDKNSVYDLNGIPLTNEDIEDYNLKDEKGLYKLGATLMRTGESGSREKRPKGYYPIYVSNNLDKMSIYRMSKNDYEVYPKTRDGKEMSWRRSKENLGNTIDEFIIKSNNGNISFYKKQRLEEDMVKGKKAKTLFYKPEYSSGNGITAIKGLLKERVFDNPKPLALIKDFIRIGLNKDDIILDFFSGSSTTAHAVMQLNEEDGGNRKYIMVQLPELTDEKSEAYKAGYKNICEIGKERIRRAGDKILEDNKDKEGIENLDIGFKVFRVENSNIRWQNQLEEDGQIRYDLDGKSIDDIDFVVGTKDIDVVYEILLRHYGIPLTAKIEMLDFIGPRTYAIEDSIIVCLETQITKDIVDKISELEPVKVIFRDSAFGDNISLKQNSVHRLNVLIEKNNKNTTHVVEFI